MLCCIAVLNTELIRVHSSIEHGLPDSTATTSECGISTEHTSSYLSERREKLVVLLVFPHFREQATDEQ